MDQKKIQPTSITLTTREKYDLECLYIGAFSPLEGFMTLSEYKGCISNEMKLPNGKIWPIPITLAITLKTKEELRKSRILLLRDSDNTILAKIVNPEVYDWSFKDETIQVVGTSDKNHPYCKILQKKLDSGLKWLVGGKIEMVNHIKHGNFNDIRLTPSQTKNRIKDIKKSKNISIKRIVGFQTRNPTHGCHFELMMRGLYGCGTYQVENRKNDGLLFFSPIIGPTQAGDIPENIRIKCYKSILKYFPHPERVILVGIPLAMRMAGPREALWHSIIRKNYGCSHFIIGRDHAGPSKNHSLTNKKFYKPYDAQELVAKFSEKIGIKMVPSAMLMYFHQNKEYMTNSEAMKLGYDNGKFISGTSLRKKLSNGEEVPKWFSFPEEIKILKEYYSLKGCCIYLYGLSGAGKSTIGKALKEKLEEIQNKPVTFLDGDIVRQNLSKGLGFSKQDRSTNVRRVGYVASEIVKHGGLVICSNIAPYQDDRSFNRKLIERGGKYIEIFVNTSLEKCEERDVKGLYKLARSGVIKCFTGISDPFEGNTSSDLVITGDGDISTIIEKIIGLIHF